MRRAHLQRHDQPDTSDSLRIIRRKQRASRLFVQFLPEGMLHPDRFGPGRCRAGINRLEPALGIRKISQGVVGTFHDPYCAHQLAPGGDVGECIFIADDVFAALQMLVEHLLMTLDLPTVTVNRIVIARRRGVLEMHRLPGERAPPRGDEKQP